MSAQLYLGDGLSFLRDLPPNSIDSVFMDPPYGHNNNNNGDLISRWEAALGRGDYRPERDNRPLLNDGREANDLIRAVLPEINRVLKPGGCCCCCCGGGGPDPQFARWSLWMDEAMQFKQMVVWNKGPMGMGWHYRRSYETVLVGQKKGARCAWYDDSHRVENVIRPGDYGIRKIIPSKSQHPTAKPVALAAHFIRLHTKPGDIVLDPFMGAASTGEAALSLERDFIGVELDPVFYRMARTRLGMEEGEVAA